MEDFRELVLILLLFILVIFILVYNCSKLYKELNDGEYGCILYYIFSALSGFIKDSLRVIWGYPDSVWFGWNCIALSWIH